MSKILGFTIKLLMGIVLFVGLPLIGWGVMDFQGFMGHPARIAYVALAILLQIVVVSTNPDVGRGGREGKQIVTRQRVAVLLLQVLSLSIMLAAPYTDRWNVAAFGELTLVRYLGLALFALIYRSWLALVLVVVLVGVLLWRIHDEEALMGQAFGAEWEAYTKRSWRLIPYVY